jgi:probable HAF family extracellular repeat protein
MEDLGTLGGIYSSANGTNDLGEVVGEFDVTTNFITNIHAFLYTNGDLQYLGALPWRCLLSSLCY